MKYRKGFVTNSSSSSFVIAYKDISTMFETNKTEFMYLKKINKLLEDKLILVDEDSWYGSYEGIVLSNKTSVKNYFIEHFVGKEMTLNKYFKQYPSRKNDYDNMINYIEQGYKIIIKEVNNCDIELFDFIKNMSDNKNFIIIDEY